MASRSHITSVLRALPRGPACSTARASRTAFAGDSPAQMSCMLLRVAAANAQQNMYATMQAKPASVEQFVNCSYVYLCSTEIAAIP